MIGPIEEPFAPLKPALARFGVLMAQGLLWRGEVMRPLLDAARARASEIGLEINDRDLNAQALALLDRAVEAGRMEIQRMRFRIRRGVIQMARERHSSRAILNAAWRINEEFGAPLSWQAVSALVQDVLAAEVARARRGAA